MKFYGQVKGRKYYAQQPLPQGKERKILCPRCRHWKPESKFLVGKTYRIECKECREDVQVD